MSYLLQQIKRRVKHWWISMLIGILALVLAVWALVTPDKTLVAIVYVFITMFFISGIVEIAFAVSNREVLRGWGWGLTNGILEIVLGVILLIMPTSILTTILLYLVGFWILFRSLGNIGESVDLQLLGVRGWGWFLALGILGIIASIIFLISPAITGIFTVSLISVALLFYGASRIHLAIGFRRINKLISYDNGEKK